MADTLRKKYPWAFTWLQFKTYFKCMHFIYFQIFDKLCYYYMIIFRSWFFMCCSSDVFRIPTIFFRRVGLLEKKIESWHIVEKFYSRIFTQNIMISTTSAPELILQKAIDNFLAWVHILIFQNLSYGLAKMFSKSIKIIFVNFDQNVFWLWI